MNSDPIRIRDHELEKTMNVKELKRELDNLPDDMEVILQSDAEGNKYSPLRLCDSEAIYVPRAPWYGDVYPTDSTAFDNGLESDMWEFLKQSKPRCLVMAPVN